MSKQPVAGSWMRLLIGLLVLCLPVCRATAQSQTIGTELEQRQFDGRQWRTGFSQAKANQRITEWVLPGQRVERWTELVTHFYFEPRQQTDMSLSLLKYFQAIEHSGKVVALLYPQTPINGGSEPPTQVVYEYKTGVGPNTEYGLHRLFAGERGIHHVQYAAKDPEIFAAAKKRWVTLLRDFNPRVQP